MHMVLMYAARVLHSVTAPRLVTPCTPIRPGPLMCVSAPTRTAVYTLIREPSGCCLHTESCLCDGAMPNAQRPAWFGDRLRCARIARQRPPAIIYFFFLLLVIRAQRSAPPCLARRPLRCVEPFLHTMVLRSLLLCITTLVFARLVIACVPYAGLLHRVCAVREFARRRAPCRCSASVAGCIAGMPARFHIPNGGLAGSGAGTRSRTRSES